jgi:hypothetical protein
VTARTYASPEAFKQALEQRLRSAAGSGPDFTRRRQLLVFDRFLARVVAALGDLRLTGSAEDVLGRLQAAARLDLADFLAFEVVPDAEHPEITNEGMQYEGMRFRAECRLAGKPYGDPLQLVLPDVRPIAVAAAGIGGDEDLARARVALAAQLLPPCLDGGDREHRGVVVDADADEAIIGAHIVDAVRDGLSIASLGKSCTSTSSGSPEHYCRSLIAAREAAWA